MVTKVPNAKEFRYSLSLFDRFDNDRLMFKIKRNSGQLSSFFI